MPVVVDLCVGVTLALTLASPVMIRHAARRPANGEKTTLKTLRADLKQATSSFEHRHKKTLINVKKIYESHSGKGNPA